MEKRTFVLARPVRVVNARNLVNSAGLILMSALAGVASAAPNDGGGLDFDVSSIKTSVMAILTVGVAISIAFAVYRVGKRATNRI